MLHTLSFSASGEGNAGNIRGAQIPQSEIQKAVLATFFKHGTPNLPARISNFQARPCL